MHGQTKEVAAMIPLLFGLPATKRCPGRATALALRPAGAGLLFPAGGRKKAQDSADLRALGAEATCAF